MWIILHPFGLFCLFWLWTLMEFVSGSMSVVYNGAWYIWDWALWGQSYGKWRKSCNTCIYNHALQILWRKLCDLNLIIKFFRLENLSKNGQIEKILLKYRKFQLYLDFINTSFRSYLVVFPAVGGLIVATLIYGTIKIWRVSPEANIMFPLCTLRCGFEAMTPLGMAGSVNGVGESIMEKWKSVKAHTISGLKKRNNKKAVKMTNIMQKSCRALHCNSGSYFTFESSIYLVTFDNIIQQSVNMLMTFPELWSWNPKLQKIVAIKFTYIC